MFSYLQNIFVYECLRETNIVFMLLLPSPHDKCCVTGRCLLEASPGSQPRILYSVTLASMARSLTVLS